MKSVIQFLFYGVFLVFFILECANPYNSRNIDPGLIGYWSYIDTIGYDPVSTEWGHLYTQTAVINISQDTFIVCCRHTKDTVYIPDIDPDNPLDHYPNVVAYYQGLYCLGILNYYIATDTIILVGHNIKYDLITENLVNLWLPWSQDYPYPDNNDSIAQCLFERKDISYWYEVIEGNY